MKQKTSLFFFSLVVFLIPLLFSSLITNYVIVNEAYVANWGAQEWLIATFILIITSALALTPPTFLAVVLGYFLSWKAFPSLALINLGGIFILYFLGNYLSKTFFSGWLKNNEKATKILNTIKQDELKVIFLSKLSPALPFTLTNLIFTYAGASLKNMTLGGFFGMIPRTLLAIFVGSQGHEIRILLENPNKDLYTKVAIILLFVLSTLGLINLLHKRLKA